MSKIWKKSSPAQFKPMDHVGDEEDQDELLAEGLTRVENLPSCSHKWNTNEEIASYLFYAKFNSQWLTDRVQQRPSCGSMLMYNKKRCNYKQDGYIWKKRKDGKMSREDHMHLKVKGVELINANYVHSSILPTFHRRSYWLLWVGCVVMLQINAGGVEIAARGVSGHIGQAKSHWVDTDLVLVHYLNTSGGMQYFSNHHANKIIHNMRHCKDLIDLSDRQISDQIEPMLFNENSSNTSENGTTKDAWLNLVLKQWKICDDESKKLEINETALIGGSFSVKNSRSKNTLNELHHASCSTEEPRHKILRQPSAFSDGNCSEFLGPTDFGLIGRTTEDSAYCSVNDCSLNSSNDDVLLSSANHMNNFELSNEMFSTYMPTVDSAPRCNPSLGSISGLNAADRSDFSSLLACAQNDFSSHDADLNILEFSRDEINELVESQNYAENIRVDESYQSAEMDRLRHQSLTTPPPCSYWSNFQNSAPAYKSPTVLNQFDPQSTAKSTVFIVDYSPDWSPCEGGEKILITGGNFCKSHTYLCKFGCKVTPAIFVQSGVLKCLSPPNRAGKENLSILCVDDNVESNAVVFTYKSCSSNSLAPTSFQDMQISDPWSQISPNFWLDASDYQFVRLFLNRLRAIAEIIFGTKQSDELSRVDNMAKNIMREIEKDKIESVTPMLEHNILSICQKIFNHALNNGQAILNYALLYQRGLTSLHFCARLGFEKVAKFLLNLHNNGIPQGQAEFSPTSLDDFGRAPIVWACLHNKLKTALILLPWSEKFLLRSDQPTESMPLVAAFRKNYSKLVLEVTRKFASQSSGCYVESKDFDTALWVLTGGLIDRSQLRGGDRPIPLSNATLSSATNRSREMATIVDTSVFAPGFASQQSASSTSTDPLTAASVIHRKRLRSGQQIRRCLVLSTNCDIVDHRTMGKNDVIDRFDHSDRTVNHLESVVIDRSSDFSHNDMTAADSCFGSEGGVRLVTSPNHDATRQSMNSQNGRQWVDEEDAQSLKNFGAANFTSPLDSCFRLSPAPANEKPSFRSGRRSLNSDMDDAFAESPSPPSSAASSYGSSTSLANFACQLIDDVRDVDGDVVGTNCTCGAGRRSTADLTAFFNDVINDNCNTYGGDDVIVDCDVINDDGDVVFGHSDVGSTKSVALGPRTRPPLDWRFGRLTLSDREQRELFEAAKVIQNAYRQYKLRVQNMRKIETEKRAATVIQSYYRRYKQFCYFKKVHRAAALIQRHFRSYKANKKRRLPASSGTAGLRSPPRLTRATGAPPLGLQVAGDLCETTPTSSSANLPAAYRRRRRLTIGDPSPTDHTYHADIGGPSLRRPQHKSSDVTDDELKLWKRQVAAIKIQHAFRMNAKKIAPNIGGRASITILQVGLKVPLLSPKGSVTPVKLAWARRGGCQ